MLNQMPRDPLAYSGLRQRRPDHVFPGHPSTFIVIPTKEGSHADVHGRSRSLDCARKLAVLKIALGAAIFIPRRRRVSDIMAPLGMTIDVERLREFACTGSTAETILRKICKVVTLVIRGAVSARRAPRRGASPPQSTAARAATRRSARLPQRPADRELGCPSGC
jgi:hypothetical protein